MAGTAVLGRLNWLPAKVVSKRDETPRVRSIIFECPMWDGHVPGQHVDIRLTADDGYQAQRSYSIASAPEDDHLMLTVERLDYGEVSPYLVDELREGDELELRGPIGRYFVWEAGMGGPLMMIAGGSGVVPFRSMLRHRDRVGSDVPARLLFSARTLDDVIYRDELATPREGVEVTLALTREQPEGWGGYDRRVDAAILEEVAWAPREGAAVYVCGPTGFVETVANSLVDPHRALRSHRLIPIEAASGSGYAPGMTSTYSVRYREYAEAIWEIEEEGIPVIQARIADWLGVSRASVSEMIHRMADEGLLVSTDRIELTEEGRHLAAVIVRRHRLAERFLSDVLHLGWDKVHAEAEVWETTISDQVEDAMWAVLNDPKTCPHGNPIPGAGYKPPKMKPLSEIEPGEDLRLERISEELELDADMMRFLDESGLRPEARVELVHRDPHGSVTIKVNGNQVGVGQFAADRLFVSKLT